MKTSKLYFFLLLIFLLIFNSCLKTETSCKKIARLEFLENCKNQILTQTINDPNTDLYKVIKSRETRAICLLSFLSYEEEKSYCNQPLIYWQNDQKF